MNYSTQNIPADSTERKPEIDAKETSESNKNSDNFARTFGAKPTRKTDAHDETTPADPEQTPTDQDPEGEPELAGDPADEPWPVRGAAKERAQIHSKEQCANIR